MNLYERLIDNYGKNNAFRLKDLEYQDLTTAAVKNSLKRLVEKGLVKRYTRGVYYIPGQSIFGTRTFNSEKFVENTYLHKDEDEIGIYTGYRLLNELGLTTQVPAVVEIMSNNTTVGIKEEKYGPNRIILRKPPVKITKRNAPLLKVLELVKEKQFQESGADIRKKTVKKLVSEPYSQAELNDVLSHYPLKTSRELITTGAIYEIAQ